MKLPQVELLYPLIRTPKGVAYAIWNAARCDEEDPRLINLGVIISSEAECKPMVFDVEHELVMLVAERSERDDIGIREVCARQLGPSKWAVVARIYT